MGPGDRNKNLQDIYVDYPEDKHTACQICNFQAKSANALAGHIGAKHRISFEDYLVEYFMGDRPLCPVCGDITRYNRGNYSFKKYCGVHSSEARSTWSKANFKLDAAWKKGLTKETNAGIMNQSIKVSGHNNWMSLTEKEYQEKLQRIALENKFIVSTLYSEYINNTQELDCICTVCDIKQKHTLQTLQKKPICRTCLPAGSIEEKELVTFIKDLGFEVVENTRKIITPKELDILVESKQLAIEYNGLFTHSEAGINKTESYHINKTKECAARNIKLIHIFSDEWLNKQNIIKSMIKYRLGVIENKIYARDCVVKEVQNKEANIFFTNNHIAGNITNARVNFGLYYNNELVSCVSLRAASGALSKNNQIKSLELGRFASKLDTNVVGAFSKLLPQVKEWAVNNGYYNILTYADLRFGTGGVYEQSGFVLEKTTRPDYWYTNGKERFNRFNYRAQPENKLTEKQVAEQASVYKIYGCGSNLYKLNLN